MANTKDVADNRKESKPVEFNWDGYNATIDGGQEEGTGGMEERPARLGLGADYLSHAQHLRTDAGGVLKKRLKKQNKKGT